MYVPEVIYLRLRADEGTYGPTVGDGLPDNYDITKLCDLIEAVVNNCGPFFESDTIIPTISLKKVQRLCYFCDFDHFEKHSRSISDCIYVRTNSGPVPIYFDKALKELVTDDRVMPDGNLIRVPFRQVTDIREAGRLPADQMETVFSALERYAGLSEDDLNKCSRRDNPSIIAGDHQALDYLAAYYRSPDYSVGDDDDDGKA